jgi:hypothetical protein
VGLQRRSVQERSLTTSHQVSAPAKPWNLSGPHHQEKEVYNMAAKKKAAKKPAAKKAAKKKK